MLWQQRARLGSRPALDIIGWYQHSLGVSNQAVPYSTTLHVRDSCLCLHAQRAARLLARRFDEALRPAGLTNQQFSLLMSLNRPEPPPISPVAALLGMDRTSLTAALKPLQRRGYVELIVPDHDRRARLIKLTDAGAAALAGAMPIWTQTHAEVEGRLPGDPDRLRADLKALS
jgi:DNA-binding MarR family transcriptional regulator